MSALYECYVNGTLNKMPDVDSASGFLFMTERNLPLTQFHN